MIPSETKTIKDIIYVPICGAYYYEDLAALHWAPLPIARRYLARPISPGFKAVRQIAEGISVGLVLDDGRIAWGDCIAVCYSGKAGRDPVFNVHAGIQEIQELASPVLRNRELTSFRDIVTEIDQLSDASGKPLHTAVRYGLSQTVLQAMALCCGLTMTEVIVSEYGLSIPDSPVPIHAQCGHDRYDGADKMIVHRVASLPHALIDDINGQLGEGGANLIQYVQWLRERILELGNENYKPTIHLDMHGSLSTLFSNQMGLILGFLFTLANAAQPYQIRIEDPISMTTRSDQIQAMSQLRTYLLRRKIQLQIVADEWANTIDDIQAFCDVQAADMVQIKMPDLGSIHNTIDAVLACKQSGVGTLLGGSCAETDLSSRVSCHIALATLPDLLMAKPGMGIDEGIMLVNNEMARTISWITHRKTD